VTWIAAQGKKKQTHTSSWFRPTKSSARFSVHGYWHERSHELSSREIDSVDAIIRRFYYSRSEIENIVAQRRNELGETFRCVAFRFIHAWRNDERTERHQELQRCHHVALAKALAFRERHFFECVSLCVSHASLVHILYLATHGLLHLAKESQAPSREIEEAQFLVVA